MLFGLSFFLSGFIDSSGWNLAYQNLLFLTLNYTLFRYLLSKIPTDSIGILDIARIKFRFMGTKNINWKKISHKIYILNLNWFGSINFFFINFFYASIILYLYYYSINVHLKFTLTVIELFFMWKPNVIVLD